jgi:hypothetical protein
VAVLGDLLLRFHSFAIVLSIDRSDEMLHFLEFVQTSEALLCFVER